MVRIARGIDEVAAELIQAVKALYAAGYWVVVVYPRGFKARDGAVKKGKEPFGKGWGLDRRTPEELINQIRYFERQEFVPGIGICLAAC